MCNIYTEENVPVIFVWQFVSLYHSGFIQIHGEQSVLNKDQNQYNVKLKNISKPRLELNETKACSDLSLSY